MKFEITYFDERVIAGLIDAPGEIVEFFVGDKFVGEARSSYRDSGDGYVFEFENPVGPYVGLNDLLFRCRKRLDMPSVAPRVAGYIRKPVQVDRVLRDYYRTLGEYPLVPQDILNYIGSGEAGQHGFRYIGFVYFYYLLTLIGISPGTKIVDIGCGAGRIGFALAPYLNSGGGKYLGLDTWGEGISWANKELSSKYPVLSFGKLESPPQGRRKGYLAEYAAPIKVEPSSVDVVLCTSLFTHLKKAAYSQYLADICSMLKSDGVALITTFLISEQEEEWVRSTKANSEDAEGLYVLDDTYADSYLRENLFFDVVRESGLKLCRYLPGHWRSKMPGATRQVSSNFQDMLILSRL